jgi:hypothetical protein
MDTYTARRDIIISGLAGLSPAMPGTKARRPATGVGWSGQGLFYPRLPVST